MACTVLPQGLSSWDADAYVAVLSPVRTIGVLDNPPTVASGYLIIGCIADNNHRVINLWPTVVIFSTRATLLSENATSIEFEAGRGANGHTYGLILHEVFHVFRTEVLLDAKLHETVELSVRTGGVLANQLFPLVALIVVILFIEPSLLLTKHPCHVGQPTGAAAVVVVAIEEVLGREGLEGGGFLESES
jgi:hypothetical protein